MLRHKSTAAIFPLALVLAVGVERVATSLLGTFPGEPVVWMISGEFRRMLRPISELLTTLSGGSLTLQAVLIAACTFAIWMALTTRRWETPALLLNNFALIAFLAVTFVSGGATTVGLSFAGWQMNEASLFLAEQSSGLQLAILATGVAGCVFSHVCFLRSARSRQQAIAAALMELCVGTVDSGSETRNRLSRSR